MIDLEDQIAATFGGKVRVRACGVLVEKGKILLIKHLGVGSEGFLWAPPGGGVNLGESVKETVKREFLEETGLTVSVKQFLFFNEFVNLPLHSIELFFKVKRVSGVVVKGIDPEIDSFNVIDSIAFKSLKEIHEEGIVYYHSFFKDLVGFEDFE